MSSVDDLIESAYDALEAGESQKALELGRRVLAKAPDDPEGHYIAGAALCQLESFEEAIPPLERSVELDPEAAESALAFLGTARFERLDLAGARRDFERAVELVPEFAEAHWSLGLVEERAGNEEQARIRFDRARALAPRDYPAAAHVSEEKFRSLVEAAIAELPPGFRDALDNLAILVEPLPPDEILAGEPPLSPTILGLHVGTPMDERSHAHSGDLPNTIFLFQRNVERAATNREELVEQIEVTLLHEIGHYLGLDEDEVDERGLH